LFDLLILWLFVSECWLFGLLVIWFFAWLDSCVVRWIELFSFSFFFTGWLFCYLVYWYFVLFI
jgi:hypothetical protein